MILLLPTRQTQEVGGRLPDGAREECVVRHPSVVAIAVTLVLLAGVLSFGSVQSGRTLQGSPEASDATPMAAPLAQRCMRLPEEDATPVAEDVIFEFAAEHAYEFQEQSVVLHAMHVVFEAGGTWAGCFTFQTLFEIEHGSFTLNVPAAECGFVTITKADGTSGGTGDPCGIPADTDVPLEAGDTVVLDASRATITNSGDTPGALLLASLADDDSGCGGMPCP